MPRYRIVPERSRVVIDAKSSVHPIHSSTDGLEGDVELELGADGRLDLSSKPSGRVSMPASRLSSGNRLEDRELYRRIDVRRYPRIEGVLEQMESSADGSYRVTGEVTFRGVSRQKVDEMTVEALDDRTVRLAGSSVFDIRDYGMEPPRVLTLRVDPQVTVSVEIVAVKEA